jgi:predicted RNA-binding Zn-ribbon protein involved in translation (DUF1610 family)
MVFSRVSSFRPMSTARHTPAFTTDNLSTGVLITSQPGVIIFSVPDRTECPRCHKTELVRQERVMRGNDPYVNHKCDGCGYSWQVKDAPERQATAGKRSTS